MTSTAALALLGILSGCSKKAPEPTAVKGQPAAAVQAEEQAKSESAGPAAAGHGSRKLKGIDVPVYVDGEQKSVLRFGELPNVKQYGAEFDPEFRLADYLKEIGVAPESVKSVYLFDQTNRIASIEGKELNADRARFVFHFTSGNTGNAETVWDTTGLKNTFIVHEIRRVSVFVNKAAPAIDPQRQCILNASHDCEEKMPYASVDPAKGTRVYMDGHLVGVVKRRLIGDDLVLGTTEHGERKLSVAKLAASFGVDPQTVKSVELVSGDDLVARGDAATWSKYAHDMYFTLPEHQHGKVRVHVPADMQAKDGAAQDRDALVTSVLLHKSTSVPNREVVAISEATDLSAQLASNQVQARRGEEPTTEQ